MLVDDWGVGCNAQVVGVAYNPKKLPKPTGYADLLKDPGSPASASPASAPPSAPSA
ncbi:hypothetical protein ACFQY5_17645 [Paeniroseomonas aquatica]|uniref:hypothetical protein n=1 Tax=Paeniroseomonas aquatica TaxID=373043 RepID=UPI003609BA0C